MRTVVAVAMIIALVIAAYLLMWRGWRRRGAAQADLPPLPEALPPGAPHYGPVEGVYVGTTTAGDWLDRVVAHRLGLRSPAVVTVSAAGVQVDRSPEPVLALPAASLRSVRIDRAAAGRAVHGEEYLIITWSHADRVLDTAVRPHHHDDLTRLRDAIAPLAGQGAIS